MAKKVQKYILMYDRVGEHVEKDCITSHYVTTQLVRGEIVEALPESDQPEDPDRIALKAIYSDANIKLECSTLYVVKLSDSEADLLGAVSSLEERFRIFRERNRLTPGKALDVGATVLVKLKNNVKEYKGIIWYKGPLPTHKGTMFGVELLDKEAEGQGTSDGTFGNKKYFDCPQDRGVFVALDKLRPHQDTAKPPKKEPGLTYKIKDYFIPSSKDSYSHNKLIAQDHQLKIDQRVVVYIHDEPCRGTVRYISKEKCDGIGDRPIGIELDKRMGSGNGVFKGKQRFVCMRNYAAFLPVSVVIPEEYFDASNSATVRSRSDRLTKSDGLRGSFGHIVNTRILERRNPQSSVQVSANVDVKSGVSGLEVGSMVEVPIMEGKATNYGVIRWIGQLPGLPGKTMAGLELEEEQAACSDGVYNGQRYFTCPPGRGFFVNLQSCRRDSRFRGESSGAAKYSGKEIHEKHSDINSGQLETFLAEQRGILSRQVPEKGLQSSEQISQQLETSFSQLRQAFEETERCLQSSEQRSQELETFLIKASQAHKETEIRLQNSEQRAQQLETSLSQERQAHEETERRLQNSEQRAQQLETSLSQASQSHEETEIRLQNSEQRAQQLETSLSQASQSHEETEIRLQNSEQRAQQLETSLSQERQAREETERRLQNSEQRSDRLETSLVEESQRSNELENTLATVRQALEECRNSRTIAERDWVLLRSDIVLSDRQIGIGAWGKVKEGTFRGCKVAVKEFHHLILSPHNRRLFEREMSMASRCRHPCLLQFIGATYDDQSPLFVTELLDTSLRAVLQERALQPTEIKTIALDVAKGLNYLHLSHPAPIIHRDISSANVLLWKHGTTWSGKVSDYGTANVLQQSMTASPGAVIYSAPEAQTSRQTPKVDVYSYGVLLCEMNIREMPDVEHREEQVSMVTNNFFRNLIRRCLQQNPEERPTMAEIIGELENSP